VLLRGGVYSVLSPNSHQQYFQIQGKNSVAMLSAKQGSESLGRRSPCISPSFYILWPNLPLVVIIFVINFLISVPRSVKTFASKTSSYLSFESKFFFVLCSHFFNFLCKNLLKSVLIFISSRNMSFRSSLFFPGLPRLPPGTLRLRPGLEDPFGPHDRLNGQRRPADRALVTPERRCAPRDEDPGSIPTPLPMPLAPLLFALMLDFFAPTSSFHGIRKFMGET